MRPLARIERELRTYLARERYTRGLSVRMLNVLRPAFVEVVTQLATGQLAIRERQQLVRTYADLRQIMIDGYAATNDALLQELAQYHVLEADVARAMLPDVAQRLVGRALVGRIGELPIEGQALGKWFAQMADGMTARIRQQLQLGLTLGEGPGDIARRIYQVRGTAPSVWNRARRDVVAFVRTATTAVQNGAAMDTWRAGSAAGVVAFVQFVAVRDARTTAICRGFDGEQFKPTAKNVPIPPLHINCRSTLRPIVDPAAFGLTGKAAQQMRDFTDPAKWQTYDQWLARQSADAQDAILGPKGGAQYRRDGSDLANAMQRDARTLTLAQLRKQLTDTW